MGWMLLPFGWPQLAAPSAGSRFGAALTGADLDGDGRIDLAVGAPDEAGVGAVHVYLGEPGGFPDTPSVSFEGPSARAEYGSALFAADLDGDGIAELLVGAPGADAVEIVTGLAPEGTWLEGEAGTAFGTAVSAGDVDGDGITDVVVGAPDAGAVWLFTDGLATTTTWVSATAGDELGATVAADGDVDGDGADEVLVGAPGATRVDLYPGDGDGTATWSWAGEYTFEGGRVSFGDFDGNGLADALCAPEQGIEVATAAAVFLSTDGALPAAPSWSLGWMSAEGDAATAAALGDLDGDGVDELAWSSATAFEDSSADCGGSYCRSSGVVWGSPAGPDDWTNGVVADTLAVAAVGDVDQNGVVDVAFGTGESVTVRPILADADGDGWSPEWSGALADCDDADAGVYPFASEADGDAVDADCDGEVDRSAWPGWSCPTFTSFPEAKALATHDAVAAYAPLDLIEEVEAALAADAATLVTEEAPATGDPCPRESWSYGAWAAGEQLHAYRESLSCSEYRGAEYWSTRSFGDTWSVATFDPPTSSGVASARLHQSDDDGVSGVGGRLVRTDGSAGTFSWSWDEGEDADRDGFWTRWDGAELALGTCAFSLWYQNDMLDERWRISDGTHEIEVSTFHDSLCGYRDGGEVVWATWDDDDGRALDAATWDPGVDADADGWPIDFDCDDADPAVNPCAAEVDGNDVDEDCDGEMWVDLDGDGVERGDDCDDADPALGERWNGWPDADGDGYGDATASSEVRCTEEPGWAHNHADCDDGDPEVRPAAEDPCDEVDQDCDGVACEVADTGSPGPRSRPEGGCGCSTPGAPTLLGLAPLLLALRRRRR